jgi:S-adenosylmethionine-diacylgycerolhomoserine-N-methlytransferase
MPEQNNTPSQQKTMRGYYRFHAQIYDATRWSFLFGRNAIIDLLKEHIQAGTHIAEIGCGSGYNLERLARQFPGVQFTGIDASGDMLEKAAAKTRHLGNRIHLKEELYSESTFKNGPKPDIILISYCLTMINPGWLDVIEQAWKDLPQGGVIAVVDFHLTHSSLFEKWMKVNHVRMNGHLLPELEIRFAGEKKIVKKAYGGWWEYFLFTGIKQSDH